MRAIASRHTMLTPREAEVLHWIAEGKSNSAIATILALSPATVKCHVERILAKLGVENRTAAARIALGESRGDAHRPFGGYPDNTKTA